MMQPAAPSAARSAIAGRLRSGCSVWKLRATGLTSSGRNQSIAFPAFGNHTQIDAFGLFTGQIGYAFNNVLLYVKGGAAVTSNRHRSYAVATGTIGHQHVDDTRWGGAIGAGLEYGFAPNWSFGVEYNHLFMQDRTYTFINNGVAGVAGTLFGTDRIRQDVDLVTARINYRSAARSSRGTDRESTDLSIKLKAPASSGAFLRRLTRSARS